MDSFDSQGNIPPLTAAQALPSKPVADKDGQRAGPEFRRQQQRGLAPPPEPALEEEADNHQIDILV